jgi:uncharacterized membrane protein YeaQ/YmgE (transglycosylase-associated protein family)
VSVMDIIAWIILGALAGWLAGLVVGGTGMGVIGTIVMGIIGALVGGWLASNVFGIQTGAQSGELSIPSIIVATLGAIIVVAVVSLLIGRRARV